jgi:ATP-dependent Lon protease
MADKNPELLSGDLLPVLPLRDIVVFPHMIVPLFVGREKSVRALEAVMRDDKQILLVAQKNAAQDDPGAGDLYEVGTVSTVLQLLKLPDGTVKVLVEGGKRARVTGFKETDQYFEAYATPIDETVGEAPELEALSRTVVTQFEQYIKLNKKIAPEVLVSINQIEDAAKLADTVASHLNLKISEKQELLDTPSVSARLERVFAHMESEIGVLQVEKRIRNRVKRQMEKTQREYYLNEQMKAIQKELGEGEDGKDELAELEERRPRRCSTPTITASTRSRSGSWSIWRCSRARRRSGGRSCASSARRAWVRPRWASRSPRPPTVTSSGCPWAACGMRPRCVATGGPISAPCRARSSRA